MHVSCPTRTGYRRCPLSGRDPEVRAFLEREPAVGEYIAHIRTLVDHVLPRIEADDRAYLTLAVGCTGGRHRSVYIIERLAEHLRTQGRDGVQVFHRELS